jgi:hypothetical protein
MISTKIFYFSFFFVAQMSAVSAYLTAAQIARMIHWLHHRTANDIDWAPTFRSIDPDVLDNYLARCVRDLGGRVNIYLNGLNPEASYVENLPPAPDPTLDIALNGFPKLVMLLRYSNLTILNDLKRSLRLSGHLLGIINDGYLREESSRYRHLQPVESGYSAMPYMEELAVLFSINKAILSQVLRLQGSRLSHYQNMINTLHEHIARFMRVAIEHPYSENVETMRDEIKALDWTEIFDFSPFYMHPGLDNVFTNLSHHMLAVILIYGGTGEYGSTEIISDLLNNHRVIRFFLHVERVPRERTLYYCRQIISSLAQFVNGIAVRLRGRHRWISDHLGLANTVLLLLGNDSDSD